MFFKFRADPFRISGNAAAERQVAAEVRLNPSEFCESAEFHFQRANEGLADLVAADEDGYRARFGDEFVDAALEGERPEGWTWHHALTSQANGEAGWMHLVPTDYHSTNFGVFHPNGIGGYQEWAVPAGAPYPR